jgi:hypothetical protein
MATVGTLLEHAPHECVGRVDALDWFHVDELIWNMSHLEYWRIYKTLVHMASAMWQMLSVAELLPSHS